MHALAATKTEKQYFVDVKSEYIKRRDFVVSKLTAMDGVLVPNPGGAFYVMAQLPIDDSDKFCQWILETFDDNGETVMMAPGAGFYSTKGMGDKQVRIAYVLNEDDLKNAVRIIEEALKVYPGRTA